MEFLCFADNNCVACFHYFCSNPSSLFKNDYSISSHPHVVQRCCMTFFPLYNTKADNWMNIQLSKFNTMAIRLSLAPKNVSKIHIHCLLNMFHALQLISIKSNNNFTVKSSRIAAVTNSRINTLWRNSRVLCYPLTWVIIYFYIVLNWPNRIFINLSHFVHHICY